MHGTDGNFVVQCDQRSWDLATFNISLSDAAPLFKIIRPRERTIERQSALLKNEPMSCHRLSDPASAFEHAACLAVKGEQAKRTMTEVV